MSTHIENETPLIFDSISDAIGDIKNGKMVVVMDDENRENEGDLIMAAQFATSDQIAFIVKHTTGILCAPMLYKRAKELNLYAMVFNGTDPKQTAFTVTTDYKDAGTGVSAEHRSLTFLMLADRNQRDVSEFRRPGHIFPLTAKSGGVLERNGHTEASVDLCRLAGVEAVGVIGEIVNDDGSMKRAPDCYKFAKENGLKFIHIKDMQTYIRELAAQSDDHVIRKNYFSYGNDVYVDDIINGRDLNLNAHGIREFEDFVEFSRLCVLRAMGFDLDRHAQHLKNLLLNSKREQVVNCNNDQNSIPVSQFGVRLEAQCQLPIQKNGIDLGTFAQYEFYSEHDNHYHTVLSLGDITREPYSHTLVRVHSECFTGDVLGSQRCDCGDQLFKSLQLIHNRGQGVLIYHRGHEGRGIGLVEKIKAYHLQQTKQMDTYAANRALGFADDLRCYDSAKSILKYFKIKKILLLSNNFEKYSHFESDFDCKMEKLEGDRNSHNSAYLKAKGAKNEQVKTTLKSLPKCTYAETSNHTTQLYTVETPEKTFHVKEVEKHNQNHHDTNKHTYGYQSQLVNVDPTLLTRLRVGIVKTQWNSNLVDPFVDAVFEEFKARGILEHHLIVSEVSGSFETPWAASLLKDQCDVILCVGLLMKGETTHFENVSNATSQGLMTVQFNIQKPIINGIFTCLNEQQALDRLDVKNCDLYKSLVGTTIHQALMTKQKTVLN